MSIVCKMLKTVPVATMLIALPWMANAYEPSTQMYGDDGDQGKQPLVFDIRSMTQANDNYRDTRWTGEFFQMVLMSLEPGEIIDLEVHNNHDQFFRVEQGTARILMGETEDDLDFDATATAGYGIMIPAGYWHQVENAGDDDLKLYTFYAPPEHPADTVHHRYEDTEGYEH